MNTILSSGGPISERTVINQAQQGDPDAFQLLYRNYKSYVSSQCRRLGCDAGVTEDLTQDVFVQLWRKIAAFKGQSAFRTWLHRMTVNAVFGYFRKTKRQNALRVETTAPSGDSTDLAERVCGTPCSLDDHILISQILASLPSSDRRILELHTAGFKHKEIARILQISGSTSRSQLFRVRAKIQSFHPAFHAHSERIAA